MQMSFKARTRAFLVQLVLVASAPGCSKSEQEPQPEVIRPVRVERIALSNGGAVHSFSGTVRAGTETKLSFKVGGTVTGLKLKVGDQLKKGQVVAALEGQDQSLQVQTMRANLTQVEAQFRNAETQYKRVKSLYANNNATRAELDSARSSFESARAGVAAAKKQLELAQSQAGKTVLHSPAAGIVAKVAVESGENVNPGQPVVIVNSESKAEVEVAVPETFIAQVKAGQLGTATLAALDGEQFDVTVTEVGITTGRTATTYPVVATFMEEDERIRSGMAAEVSISVGERGAARLLVNPKAVGEDRNGRYAFVATPTGDGFASVERRDVEVKDLTSNGLEITKGLEPGDLLVTAGLTYLVAGKKVRLPKGVQERSSKAPASGEPAESSDTAVPVNSAVPVNNAVPDSTAAAPAPTTAK